MSQPALSHDALADAHRQFLGALPRIDNVLRFHFRRRHPRDRDEALADGRAAAWHAWHGLIRRGKDPDALGPTGIAFNAVRYVNAGRRLGTATAGRAALDLYDPRAQSRLGVRLLSLDGTTATAPGARPDDWRDWRDWCAENNRVTPADEAAFRLDFQDWLDRLPDRKRQMATLLAQGHTTGAVARRLGVTPAAVSTARLWLEAHWRRFQGEAERTDGTPPPRRPVGRPRATHRTATRAR